MCALQRVAVHTNQAHTHTHTPHPPPLSEVILAAAHLSSCVLKKVINKEVMHERSRASQPAALSLLWQALVIAVARADELEFKGVLVPRATAAAARNECLQAVHQMTVDYSQRLMDIEASGHQGDKCVLAAMHWLMPFTRSRRCVLKCTLASTTFSLPVAEC